MDLTTLRLEVRERLGETVENFFSDDEVDRAINEAIRHFSAEERWPWLWTELDGDIAAGESDFDLPENVSPNRVFNFAIDADSLNTARVLERVSPHAGFRLRSANSNRQSAPQWYYVVATDLSEDSEPPVTWTVRLVPTPDVDYTISAQYLLVPPELSGDSDEPAVPEEYQDAIPAWAAGKLFFKELQISGKASEQFGIYNDILQQAKKELMTTTVDETVAWGGERYSRGRFYNERDYVMGRIPGAGLGQ